jgi:hypothetical protein
MPDKEFISIPEAVQLLFVSRSHVAKLISNGKLTAQPDGRIRMSDVLGYKSIKQAEAKAFLETHTEAEHTEAQHGQAEPPELTISFYNGEYMDDPAALTYLCKIEGSAERYDGPPLSVLDEAMVLVDMFAKRYSTPSPSGSYITVFIGRKFGTEVEPLARLDTRISEGPASASIVGKDAPHVDAALVAVDSDDDVGTIVRKILAKYLQP